MTSTVLCRSSEVFKPSWGMSERTPSSERRPSAGRAFAAAYARLTPAGRRLREPPVPGGNDALVREAIRLRGRLRNLEQKIFDAGPSAVAPVTQGISAQALHFGPLVGPEGLWRNRFPNHGLGLAAAMETPMSESYVVRLFHAAFMSRWQG